MAFSRSLQRGHSLKKDGVTFHPYLFPFGRTQASRSATARGLLTYNRAMTKLFAMAIQLVVSKARFSIPTHVSQHPPENGEHSGWLGVKLVQRQTR